MADVRSVLKLEASGTLTTGIKDRWIAPFSGEIVNVVAVVGTAPTGAALLIDVHKEGTTIFTTQANRPSIAVSTTESAVSARPDVTKFAAGDTFTLEIDQIGSTVAGADLDVTLQFIAA
jgi:hypothetical protein